MYIYIYTYTYIICVYDMYNMCICGYTAYLQMCKYIGTYVCAYSYVCTYIYIYV